MTKKFKKLFKYLYISVKTGNRQGRSQCSSSLLITTDAVIDTMPVSGLYEMSATMYNAHSTWESTSNEIVLFKSTSGAWQLDRTVENDIVHDDYGDCPSSTKRALIPLRIESQDGLIMSSRHFR